MPSQVISDINPNSLGPLQPIRAPQVPVSIPNPLSVAPFFQGQQLQQNERRLDQQDIAMALQEKQMDFAKSQLLFQQTKELLDMGDLAVDDLYKQHTSRQTQTTGGALQFGLDPTYAGHRKVLERANAQIGDFQTRIANAARGALNGGDSRAINQLLIDTKAGLSQVRSNLQTDREYMKYAVQHQKFNKFMDRVAEAQKAGLSVDWGEVRRVKGMYDAFANGEDLTNQQQGVLERSLSDAFLQDISFDKDRGYKAFKAITDAATAGQKSAGYNANIPGAPGYVAAEVYETFDDPQLVMNDIIAAAGADIDIVKMFKAATGLNPADNKEAFANWVGVQAKPYIEAGGTRVTEIGREIYDPAAVLKSRSSTTRGTDSQGAFGNDSAGVRAQIQLDDYTRQGLEPAQGYGNSDIFDVSQMKAGTTVKETDPNTGEVKIWRAQLDAQGNPVTDFDYDADSKAIPGTEHIVKVGQPLLVLRKRTTTAPAAGDDIGSQNNNPGNIRATPEQIRRGTVRVDNNGFIIFDTIEQGLEASAADNEAKISGNSEAMRNSPYMVNKYGKDALANYQDFATVEDLLNVRTPRAAVGGDNTNVQVDSFLTHLENRGFPRDLKLKELNDVEKQALNKAIVEFESPSSYARLFNPKPAETTTTPEASTEGETSTPNAPDAVQTRLLSGGDFSPEELVTELQAIGEDIPGDRYVNRFGIPGPSTFSKIGEVNADLQKAQDVVSAFDVEYSVKNKIREEKGEPLLDKTQDKEYKKAVAELNKLQTYQSKLVREFAPQAKDLLIERKFPEESAESYRLYSEAIVDTLVTSIDEIDLETISDLKGSMTESTVDGSEVIIKETGKKPLRISKSDLPNWVRQHARRSAFASTDPIELRRGRVEAIQQPTTTPTAPATPVPQTTGVITGSATGKKY